MLQVMTVPPEYVRDDDGEGFAVILGDCVLPGHILGRYPTAQLADDACREFARYYGLIGRPIEDPWNRRPRLTLILGGAGDK
jgi:hypothetical protein